MTFFLLLTLLLSCSWSKRSWAIVDEPFTTTRDVQPHDRVIGGEDVEKGRYPWVVSLRGFLDNHFCGGTLISPSLILTAAHCLTDQRYPDRASPAINIGRLATDGSASEFERRQTQKAIIHPEYYRETSSNDLAILVLDRPSTATPVKLASYNDLEAGNQLWVLGWGSTSASDYIPASTLQEVQVNYIPPGACEEMYPGRIRSGMICAGKRKGGKDSCQGDSGGPLIINNGQGEDVQVGLVSWGTGCAEPLRPGVYSSVAYFKSWIDKQIKESSGSADPEVQAFDGDQLGGDSTGICSCTQDGYSGGVQTGRKGCDQHNADQGDFDYFCMTHGGVECPFGTASTMYQGAAWIPCGLSATSLEIFKPDMALPPEDVSILHWPTNGAAATDDSTLAEGLDDCACSPNGISNGADTGIRGCGRHNFPRDLRRLCYVVGGIKCKKTKVQASELYEGAAYKVCGTGL